MRDLKNSIAVRQGIAPAAYTASVEGATVDRQGFESVTFAINVGAVTDGVHTFGAEHSDDAVDWVTVAAGDLLGTMPVAAAATSSIVGYIGNKRYVRPITTVTGSPATGGVYGADVVLGHAHSRPAT